jgi:Ca2+-binding EF-hand superfamily protein
MLVTAPAFAAAAPAPAAKPAGAAQPAPTRAALIKGLDATFKAVDTNGDGSISAAEAQAAEGKVQQQRLTRVRANVEAEFAKLDTNKDGQLSKAEFMAAAPTSAGNAPNGAAIVAQLDKNKDGKVTADEYKAPRLAMFDKLDTNHDGTISPTERQAAQAGRRR